MKSIILILLTVLIQTASAAEWACIQHNIHKKKTVCTEWRWSVPGGWIVSKPDAEMLFIPDKKHTWGV